MLELLNLNAQDLTISGRVQDAVSGEAIPYAIITVKGTKKSLTTDERGFFEIKGLTDGTPLVIFQYGYDTKEVLAVANKVNEIKLKSKSVSLNEVNVTTKKVDTLQGKNNTVFLAFEFYDNYLIALVNKGHRYNSIQILNENGEMIKERRAPDGVDKMYTDCLGNVQLLGSEYCYQLYYDYENIIVMEKFTIADFNSKIQPCQCAFGNYYYFKEVYHKRLKNRYFFISKNNKNDRKVIREVENKEVVDMFNRDYDIRYFLAKRNSGAGYATSVDELVLHMDELREQAEVSNDYAFKLIPVKSELVKRDSFLLLIDYTNKSIEKYNFLGKLLKKDLLSINSQVASALTDVDTGKLYFLSDFKGTSIVREYAQDALKVQEIVIDNFKFISNVKCRNGYLYFLYRDPLVNANVFKIYKYRLY